MYNYNIHMCNTHTYSINRLMGMDLLSIHSHEEQTFIQNLTQRSLKHNTIWLGLQRNAEGSLLNETNLCFI